MHIILTVLLWNINQYEYTYIMYLLALDLGQIILPYLKYHTYIRSVNHYNSYNGDCRNQSDTSTRKVSPTSVFNMHVYMQLLTYRLNSKWPYLTFVWCMSHVPLPLVSLHLWDLWVRYDSLVWDSLTHYIWKHFRNPWPLRASKNCTGHSSVLSLESAILITWGRDVKLLASKYIIKFYF